MQSCNQCGKPAVVLVGNNPLCVECYLKFQQASKIFYDTLIQEENYLIDMMEATIGLPGVLPRIKTPQPIVYKGPLTFHNIKVDQSVIGAINTGEVKRIDVTMDYIKTSGNNELAQALKEFTQAVIDEKEIEIKMKNEIIEQISFITSQAALPKEKQKTSIVKTVLLAIKDTIFTISSLMLLWGKLQPLLERVFS